MSDATVTELRSARGAVMSGMETGNVDYARTIITEFAELHPEAAAALSMDVISSYGIVLL